jgi:hypothetical protein
MSAISRKPLNLREFVKTGEVPPADYEEYQVWLFERSVITEKEAYRAVADHRRFRDKFNDEAIRPSQIEAAESVLSMLDFEGALAVDEEDAE